MTRLAIGSETDPLIKAAVRLELVAIIAIELLSIHRRNVGSEMALMIETQHIGIARADAFQLKFGMRFPKRIECRRKTLRRSRQLENDLLIALILIDLSVEQRPPQFKGYGDR